MKKAIILSLAFTLSMATSAFANETVNPNLTPVEAITISENIKNVTITNSETNEEVTLIMAKTYAEAIGYNVTWDQDTRTVTFKKGTNTFKATIGSNEYYADVHGEEPKTVELDAKATIIDNRTYVPSSFGQLLFDVPIVEPMPYPIPIEEKTEDNDLTENNTVTSDESTLIVTKEEIKELDSTLIEDEEAEVIAENINMKLAIYNDPSVKITYNITLVNKDFVKLEVFKSEEVDGEIKNVQIDSALFDVKVGEEVPIRRPA